MPDAEKRRRARLVERLLIPPKDVARALAQSRRFISVQRGKQTRWWLAAGPLLPDDHDEQWKTMLTAEQAWERFVSPY